MLKSFKSLKERLARQMSLQATILRNPSNTYSQRAREKVKGHPVSVVVDQSDSSNVSLQVCCIGI
jgi:hypothetical protein